MTKTSKSTLYGSQRKDRKQALALANTLKASSVLTTGEYNYTQDKLKKDVWQTSAKRDFPGVGLDRSHTIAAVTQLTEHFKFGNDSGKDVPKWTYNKSTTADSFDKKSFSKPSVLAEDKTVNWPDMAPQYLADRTMGESEYANTFVMQNRSSSAPVYPKVNTAIMQLPLDPTRFHVQRGSTYYFGTDERSKISEHQRAFGRCDQSEDFSEMMAKGEAKDVGKTMKDLERQSNVFRSGDYNGMVGAFESTTTNDFGPRTVAPAETFVRINGPRSGNSRSSQRSQASSIRPTTDIPNMLTIYARDNIVPAVFEDAEEGRNYQENAHFQFGTCEDGVNSVYGKDFKLSALAPRSVPVQAMTKDAGHVLQSDPEFSHAARSLKSSDFMAMPRPLNRMMDNNAGKKYVDHINISFDPSRHTEDRQKSVAHSDFNKHPSNYQPLPPFMAKSSPYPYLETDAALPYQGLVRRSEADHNFVGTFLQGYHAMDRRRQKEDACVNRAKDRKATHFVVGDHPGSYDSETAYEYLGRPKNDRNIAPAGKTEINPKTEFSHIGHSKNTQDLRHNDPHVTNAKEGLRARHLYMPRKGGNPFDVSVMKEDFKDVNRRSVTQAQVLMEVQNDRLLGKPWEHSHLFHTDNSGNNQFRSVTMHDFVQPENMTGARKDIVRSLVRPTPRNKLHIPRD